MTYDSNGTIILDEIDRLFVVYEKAKEYLNKISSNIDQQLDLWQYRRNIILDQINSSSSSSSFDFLLPKTQRINELTIEAVQALCRVDLLVEQILRIDPKSAAQTRSIPISTSFSARSIDTNVSNSTMNTVMSRVRHPAPPIDTKSRQSNYPIPVLRTPQQSSATRLSLAATQEKSGFKPIEQQQQQRQQNQQQSSTISENTSRPTPIHPQTDHYTSNERLTFPRSTIPSYGTRTPSSDRITSPMPPLSSVNQVPPNYNQAPPRMYQSMEAIKVKLQRIQSGTKWKKAKIDVIDSLSAFYAENHEEGVRARFDRMLEDLHDYYDSLEQSNNLLPLQNVSIGDFGVAKYTDDNHWYRARLLMCEENDRIRIVFIDFGNIETKYMHEFFPLDKLYTDLPAQAIACTLSEAFPRSPTENEILWPQDTIQIFREEVVNKYVEVVFVDTGEGSEQWPLHFVKINVGNQSVTNVLNLKQHIEPRPNQYIATCGLGNLLNPTIKLIDLAITKYYIDTLKTQLDDYIICKPLLFAFHPIKIAYYTTLFNMISSKEINPVEVLDDVDHLLFLCDRLSKRLQQVTSFVDEIKQAWINKRKSIEIDVHIASIEAQKASKCHKVLLNVAEKLAVVELQTESLHALQSATSNISLNTIEKREEQQSFTNQRAGVAFQSPSQIVKNSTINAFTPRNSASLFSEAVSVKQPPGQLQIQTESNYHRSLSGTDTISSNQQKFSSQNLLISQTSHFPVNQKPTQNGLINGYQKQSSNVIIPRPSTLTDSYSSRSLNESNVMNEKVRVKMQVIKAGTIWRNADIPIIDHPSAFFVCNQDPRVAEQFHMIAIEMNTHYNKPTNTVVPLQNPAIGDFCVARFSEDQHWYRARVVLIHSNESILIVFIDYGNSETKPANEIYPMQESLSRLPAMTVACTLAESFPRNENFWTTEATELFNQLVKNRIVEVHFQQGSGQQWPLHFVKVMLDGQSVVQHPKLVSHITSVRNEQIAMHFNDKLTSMEYILYNVAVVESDIYNGILP
ncbi:hypothetical protein I4U23_019463 [Adineta vaga]|nr:hypothetical protein I4U23_019463 [Adineta vaga]